ncbi:hypothetical protein BGAL_0043g00100 [Botrytis galanthina]|uniref:Uncharacterized protein n=1 Tax=Botrytis galanthina TaxID=278940 RepID=A0A4S8RBA2_9HELO|nr:hypothetical protein BGAL_0043g00100 [Botrytis galanthina]
MYFEQNQKSLRAGFIWPKRNWLQQLKAMPILMTKCGGSGFGTVAPKISGQACLKRIGNGLHEALGLELGGTR